MMTEEEFWAALAPLPEPKPILYRLYYNDDGTPRYFSQEDLPGNYIDIDRETFVDPPKYFKVVDGKIVILKFSSVSKLHPSKEYGTPCHPQDVSVVVEEAQPHTKWSLK